MSIDPIENVFFTGPLHIVGISTPGAGAWEGGWCPCGCRDLHGTAGSPKGESRDTRDTPIPRLLYLASFHLTHNRTETTRPPFFKFLAVALLAFFTDPIVDYAGSPHLVFPTHMMVITVEVVP